MNPMELAINRSNTVAFISADPVNIVLRRYKFEPDGAGGKKKIPDVPSGPQVFRLIPQSDIMPQVQTPDGIVLTPSYVLLGTHDSVIRRWDEFTLEGVEFKVVSPVRPDYTVESVYERKADVARL